MSDVMTPDVCVIGAGSGGLTVAAICAGFGVPVVLIEKAHMGGDCLNVGCVPSKALLAAARRAHAARDSARFGVHVEGLTIDPQAVKARIEAVIAGIAPNDSVARFTAMGVTVLQEEARFLDADTLIAGPHTIRARRFVIATGSRPFVPPIEGLNEVAFLTNETLFDLSVTPEHLVVIGGGPIGLEMAQAHRRLGADVTLIEAAGLLGREDREAAAVVARALHREGVALIEGARVVRVEKAGAGIAVILAGPEGERRIEGSHLLVAAGRKANVEALDLAKAGIVQSRHGITVSKRLRTTNRRVYAIGDVIGGLQFTHAAGYHGSLVARSILFRLPVRENRTLIPRTTYTDPEVASIGLTEDEARAAHRKIGVLRWPFHDNDRANAEGEPHGFMKLVVNKRGKILGGVVVGPSAGEVIAPVALALARGMKVSDLAAWVPAYPTLSEVAKRAGVEFYRPSLLSPTLRKLIAFLRRFG